MRISKKLSALGALTALAVGVAGCGSSIPGNSVASVAGNPITLAAFNHWMYVYAKTEAAQNESTTVINPISPPNYEDCLAQIAKQLPSVKKASSEKTLRKDCDGLFTQYKSPVMNFLIAAYWYQLQGHQAGITVSDADVQKALATEKKQAGAQFNSELASSGETMDDLLWQIQVNLIYTKLVKRETKPVTDAAVEAYYNAHKSEFGSAASATAHVLKVNSESEAQAAVAALKSGTSWADVTNKYGLTAAAKKNGGLVTVGSGSEEQVVNSAIFDKPLNTVVGPLHGTFGWYVVETTKRTAAVQYPLSKVSAEIKSYLSQNASTAAETAVLNNAKKAWKGRTKCVAVYSSSYCTNYVPTKTTTTAASTTSSESSSTVTTTGTGTASAGTSTTGTSTGG